MASEDSDHDHGHSHITHGSKGLFLPGDFTSKDLDNKKDQKVVAANHDLGKTHHSHEHEHDVHDADESHHSHVHDFHDADESHHSHEHDVNDAGKSHHNDIQRRLKIASILCLTFLVSEIVGGLVSGSLAVLSDAAHLFSDMMGFVFAVAAGHMASMPGTSNYTFGYRRWEVVTAVFSMCSLAICSIFLEYEGIRRLIPHVTGGVKVIEEIDGEVMSIIAFIGVVINICLASILGVENHVHMPGDDHHNHDHGHDAHEDEHEHHSSHSSIEITGSVSGKDGHHKEHDHHSHHDRHDHHSHHDHHDHQDHHNHHDHHDHSHSHHDVDDHDDIPQQSPVQGSKPKENINLRAAYLHVLADLVQSIAVFIAGLVIMYKPEWSIIDPILSIIFCPLIFYSTLGVIRTSMRILLEGAPPDVKVNELWSSITSIEGVTKVTGLHVWSISHGTAAMTLHARAKDPQSVLRTINHICTSRYGIDHCTIQIEDDAAANFIRNSSTAHFYAPIDSGYELV